MGTYTWTGHGNGSSVTDPANWVDQDGNPGVPGPNDTADFPIDVNLLTGVLDVAALSIEGQVYDQGGSFAVAGNLLVNTANGGLSLLSGATGTVGGDLIVGEATISAGSTQTYDSTLTINNGSTITVQGSAVVGGASDSSGEITVNPGGKLAVDGDLDIGMSGLGAIYNDDGTLSVADGSSVMLGGTNASYLSLLYLDGAAAALVTDEPLVVGNDGGGEFDLEGGATYTTVGSLVVGQGGYGAIEDDSSTLNVSGDLIIGGTDGSGELEIDFFPNTGPAVTNVSGNAILGEAAYQGGGITIGQGGTLAIQGGGSLVLGLAVDSSGNLLITASGAVVEITGTIIAGDAGAAYLTVENGGSLAIAGDQALAVQSTALASVYVANASSLSVTGTLVVGQHGTATVLVTSGGILHAADVVLAEFADGSGTITDSGGTLTIDSELQVGDGGSGSLTISDAGVASAQSVQVGTGAGNDGTLTVDGAGSSLSITNSLTIGVAGGADTPSVTISNQASITTSTGPDSSDYLFSGMLTLETGGELIETGLDMHDDATLTIESGATLAEIATSTASYIPFGLTANGTVTIDAATLASGGEYMFVGELTTTGGPGNCTFTASDGATITALATDLAEDTGDNATVTLTGDGTTWTNTFDTPVDSNDAGFNVGVEGNGSLLIEAGATLSNPLAYIKIGQFESATGTATVTDPGSTMSAGGLLRVGDSGQGTLTVENFALASVGEVQVGVYSSSTGLLTITSGGTLTTNGATTVDTGAQGGGAATLTAGEFDIGVLAHAQGTVSVDGGTLTVEGDLFVGDGGSGSLTISDAGVASAQSVQVGTGAGNDGTLTVDGAGSSLSVTNSLTIGVAGRADTPSVTISNQASITTSSTPGSEDYLFSGMLTLETSGELIETGLDMHDDATLTIESGATLAEIATSTASYIPFGLTANGTVTIDAGTLASGGEYMFVGELTTTGGPGNCTFTASDGATITALATDLAEDTGDSATVTLTGDGTTWTNTFDTPVDSNDAGFNVGAEGNGSLLIEAGATLSNPLAYIKIGQFVSATGTATVTDPGSTMSAGGLLRVGDSGQGTLTVENFALASVGEVQVGVYSSSTGLLTITSGGTLTTNGATTVDTGAQGGGAATLTAGEFDIGVLAHAQGTVSVDGGTLTVEGDLFVGDGGSGSLSVEGGGTVSAVNADIGTSTGAGTVTLGVGGTLIATAVHVGANGVVNMAGGVLDPPDTVTIDAAGDISGYGTVMGPIVDNGSITATGGTLDLTGDVSGGGTLILMPDAALQLEGTIAGTASIVFTGSQEALILGATAEVDAPVSGLGGGGSIVLEGQAVASAVYDTTNSQLAITGSGGAMFTLTLSGIHQQSDFTVVDGDVAVACFLSGTRIATEFGDVRVETLAIGDRVHTRFSGLARIKWVGRRHIDCRRHPNPRKVWPVRVRAGAFGDGAPGRDLFLSPDHAVFVDDVLIPVRYLINGGTIAQQPRDAVTYFHVELERHDVIFAEGLTCESYLDTGNRSNFEGASLPIVPHPDVSAWSWEARGCAPLVITGAALEAAQRRLVSKGSPLAGSRGSAPGLTMSPATRRPRHRTARDTPDPLPSRRYAPKAC